jgi:dipeptidyl aminopeptidase/acylaminoacyl peptidase
MRPLRPWIAAALIALALAACDDAPSPETPPQPSAAPPAPTVVSVAQAVVHAPKAPVAIEEYFKVRRIGDAKLTFDEKRVVIMSDGGGRPDLWVMPVEGSAGTQITHVDGFLHSFDPSPASDALVFEADHGGDELPHLYLTDAAGSAPKDLTADYPPGRRTDFIRWSDDGKKLYFLSSRRDEKYFDLVEYDVQKGKAETLWKASGKLALAELARDGKRWVVTETLSDTSANLYLVERGNPDKPVLLTPHQGDVLYGTGGFTRDDKQLYVTSDQGGEFTSLYVLDLAKKTLAPVLQPTWDVDGAGWSHTFRYRWTTTNVDGTPALAIVDDKTHKEVAVPPPPGGAGWSPIAFSKTDRYLTATLRSDTSPRVPYLLDLKEGKATRLADPMPDTLKGRMMVAGDVVRVPSFDGRTVPAFVYRPAGDGPFPAVIDVHGGPTWQSSRDFSPLRQYLVSKGYVVIVPNVRGSTGYGKTYTKLDNLDLGGGPLKDVVACKQWLVANAKVSRDQVVVLGQSYGGYMALAAATFTPTEFAANVDYFGISDLKSLVESFPAYWASQAAFVYQKFGDPKNPDHAAYQHDRSPLNFVDRMERPLLVVQGDKDARVKKDQSDRMVDAIKKRGVPVHYLVLANEGHGFSRNESYLAAYLATDRFLDRYIFGDTSVEVLPGEKK